MNRKDLQETNVVHRNGNLELKIYHTTGTPCHWHGEFEFVYITKGVCMLTVNSELHTLHAGQAILISGGELHALQAEENGEAFAIVLHPHICGAECTYLFTGSYTLKQIFDPSTEEDAAVLACLRKIQTAYEERGFAYELAVKAYVVEAFRIIFTHKLFRTQPKHQPESMAAFEKIIGFIHKEYRKKLTLDMLAEFCNYSKPYIIRFFKKYAGTTPVDYINHYRISKAQTLLSAEDKNVLEVSLECGFENVGYFIRTFKKHTGQTPGKWRTR